MIFNSLAFAIFFALVFPAAFVLRGHVKARNLLLLASSYFFYGWWDWRFLSLIVASTLIDYFIGLSFAEDKAVGGYRNLRTSLGEQRSGERRRSDEKGEDQVEGNPLPVLRTRRHKRLLFLSICANLGFLGFFKYFDFFIQSAAQALNGIGVQADPWILGVVLPVGISFYTFQTMSYTIDLYRGTIATERSLLNFATFVAFFPQLVAGPIERAAHLLPQLARPAVIGWDKLNLGSYWILLGTFKKVVGADNMAPLVDALYAAKDPGGVDVLIGVYAFTLQIYFDFSGYTDVARGAALMLGFDLRSNFNAPYLAKDPSDFWSRWHISLSSWLRDYLYIPLGGNRAGPRRTNINLALTMLLGGLWHGAAWAYVLWGAYQGGLLVMHRLWAHKLDPIGRWAKDGLKKTLWKVTRVLVFLQVTCLGWLIFRATSVSQVGDLLEAMISAPLRLTLDFPKSNLGLMLWLGMTLAAVQIYAAWRRDDFFFLNWPAFFRGALYAALLLLILFLGEYGGADFIYFQF